MAQRTLSRAPQTQSALPPNLRPLQELAHNLWWSWDGDARSLFAAVDPARWEAVEHNPVLLLHRLSARRSRQLADDRAFLRQLRSVHRRFRAYLRARPWYRQQHARAGRGLVAYFSMEFALHESLPIYAGGLGVLAGDHFKSASDLGLPLVGVGIFWNRGYIRQRVDAAGVQTAHYDRLRPEHLPLQPVCAPGKRQPIQFAVPMGARQVWATAWCVRVGRCPIYLLDTQLPRNEPRDRRLTDRLYIGDRESRIRQELLLGIGGWRLLQALRLPVKACHLNEGHAAFCAVDRVAQQLATCDGNVEHAARTVAARTVFTTHTPVPEGNETFIPKLVRRYFEPYCRKTGLDLDWLLAAGRVEPGDEDEPFGMTPLALRLADRRNGVSQLHGEVSRRMWQGVWPRRAEERVPIGAITNGVHADTWLHPRMAELLDAHLPSDWRSRQDQPRVWQAVRGIPAAELWQLHVELKRDLVEFVRSRLQQQCERQGLSARKVAAAGQVLDPDALTIGFARRFAAYKRATLVFSDADRLAKLLSDARRPVQLIFAGKAHPADEAGKALVAQLVKHARSKRFAGRVVFLEDYDMAVARHLVAGVDVWLNNPRRPHEASGTSGMKPALHGGLNLSILDGWWPEACVPGRNGWAIGADRDHPGSAAADRRDAAALYARLKQDVVPLYYKRDRAGLPAKWVSCMKHTLQTIAPAFNSHRMVREYLKKYYLPALRSR